MNCLPLMIKVMHEIMRNSRDHVSWTQHLEVTHAFQKSKFENLTDACINIHVYVCHLEIKLKWNELLCSREIVNRHFESKECFSAASCKVLCEFLTEAEISVFVVERRL